MVGAAAAQMGTVEMSEAEEEERRGEARRGEAGKCVWIMPSEAACSMWGGSGSVPRPGRTS